LQPNGSWLITLDIWNSSDPLPSMEGEHPEEGEHN